jgi:hypothetical protein
MHLERITLWQRTRHALAAAGARLKLMQHTAYLAQLFANWSYICMFEWKANKSARRQSTPHARFAQSRMLNEIALAVKAARCGT